MSTATDQTRQLELQLQWEPTSIFGEVDRCNGCGLCRSRSEHLRMCPLFRFFSDEDASPRAKANLLRGVLDENLGLDILADQSVKSLADRCFHCQMCRIECPGQVDVSSLAFRCKSAYAAAHGLPLTEHFFTRIDAILRFFSFFGYPLNWLLRKRSVRWLLDKSLGIPAGRKLPRFKTIPFLTRASWNRRLSRPLRREDKKVALFLDTISNFFDNHVVENAIKVLEHHGYHVLVPPGQIGNALTAIASGHGVYAEYVVQKNTALLADLVRLGYKIVSLEPAATVCLKHEYPQISKDSDATLVAENTVDLCDFLYRLHLEGQLRLDFKPISCCVGYHAPCRSLANGGAGESIDSVTSAEFLLHLIPGLDVRRLERGCCGMAGSFGLKKANYQMSLRMGVRLFSGLRQSAIQVGATDCGSCQMQMEQGSSKRTVHPIRFLAYAYGFGDDLGLELELHKSTG